jgi:hypothetical protein
MTDIRALQHATGIDPTLPAHVATKRYVDSLLESTPDDNLNYGDLFSSVERRVATSQDTLSPGFLSFSGGPAPTAISGATKLRFQVRGVPGVGVTVTFALYSGVSRLSMAKAGSDLTVTTNFATLGVKEVTIPSFSCDRGDFVYLAKLRLVAGTDPAMATTGGPATADFFNPDSTHFVAGTKGAQSAMPSTLDTSASFSGSGRIAWWSLA